MSDSVLVLPLDALDAADLDIAGGKGANLGELTAAGFPVPPGFVVTTAAYSLATAELDLSSMTSPAMAVAGTAKSAAEVRGAVVGLTIPEAVTTAITRAYAALGNGPVAVRSSATAEDLPGAAFAGQQDTYLGVVGTDAVIDAVRDCWASLWTDRAIAYRARQGVDGSDVRIAVVVQTMVEADYAGVLFTANPVTGDRRQTIIDASPGLGESVVSGLVTPDHYVLDERGRVIARQSGAREVVIRSRAGGGVDREARGAAGTAGAAPERLSDTALAELAALGQRIAKHFGTPQDIEWARADGTAWIVQARPLTALPPQPLRVNLIRRTMGAIVAELLPIRPYPLDMSTWAVHGHGRILARMVEEIPAVRIRMADMLPEVDGVVQQLLPPRPRPTLKTFTTPLRMRGRIRSFDPAEWTADRRFAAFEREVAELRSADHSMLPWAELLRMPRRSLDVLDRFIDLRIDYLPRAGVDLVRLRLRLALLGLLGSASSLTRGGTTRTTDANRALAAIAASIRANPAWWSTFDTADAEDLANRIWHDDAFETLRPSIDAFLEEFGHRETTSAFLMSEPTWSERPAILVGAIQSMLGSEPAAETTDARNDVLRHRILGLRRVRITRTGPALLRAAVAARAAIAFREDSHFHAMRALPPLRGALLEAGARLHAAGVLESPLDVLHLRLEELEQIQDPIVLGADLAAHVRQTVASRSRTRAALAGAPLISPATLYREPRRGSRALVVGTPARAGTVTGVVRIIRGPEDFGSLVPGEILVCPYTNPSWTPLFQSAVAVIVDSGGIASHAAIVAREYGIPAIMGTGNGTTVLRDGQLVTVDGDSGQVRRAS
jgi:rifampicin phosphotransferase